MPVSTREHELVQKTVEQASEEEKEALKAEAEEVLAHINFQMGKTFLSKEESKAANIAIETLVRIEAIEKGKGWWFRAKRRVQLTQMYLGN
ncbi:MAG: hypothetical protein CO093_01055 [Alphaproteobacteria bacterium CG_4_9_14_3_um_filter_47_13]|nr:MAG: hypothetical protein CO093_01055 [Alphaproteobacteria bacterium CG_4_9_14_3_um_filter_47_13]